MDSNETTSRLTFQHLAELVSREFDVPLERVTEKTSFADLDLDSLCAIELVALVEEEFGTMAVDSSLNLQQPLGEVMAILDRSAS
ncbi:acyl carrier protein [Spirillospora sp. NPDC048911]|uniref:acyl carrier protein n=1 Tax=Spirillospora sp. NPDC048911 TaxID=3364527 RepID=UPI0037122696